VVTQTVPGKSQASTDVVTQIVPGKSQALTAVVTQTVAGKSQALTAVVTQTVPKSQTSTAVVNQIVTHELAVPAALGLFFSSSVQRNISRKCTKKFLCHQNIF
jgi:hypothetical protein